MPVVMHRAAREHFERTVVKLALEHGLRPDLRRLEAEFGEHFNATTPRYEEQVCADLWAVQHELMERRR